MTEIWDIARHVEENPDDHEQRWRLAKKLYMAWEYRLALEHLQVLRNEWDHKVNVVRYLAATYYRLGRYDDAINELETAVKQWPEELGLSEQLARVYEMAGKRERAAEVWQSVSDIDPQHPIAKSAVKRLKKKIIDDHPAEVDLRLEDSDSGIDLSEGFVCPACGAQNSTEYDRCWQCHAALHENHPVKRSGSREKRNLPAPPNPETLGLIAGIAVVVLLAISLYLSITLVLNDGAEIPSTLRELFQFRMGITRIIWGVLMLVLWPASLWLSLSLLDARPKVPANFITLSGLALAALLYITTWLPTQVLLLVPLVPAVISLVLILGTLGLPLQKATLVWGLQLGLVTLCAVLGFIVADKSQSERIFNPVFDLPALFRFASQPATTDYALPPGVTEVAYEVIWKSTGSAWLDARAGETRFRVLSEGGDDVIKFEIQDANGTRAYNAIFGKQWDFYFPMQAERVYRLLVVGKKGMDVEVLISGLLKPELQGGP